MKVYNDRVADDEPTFNGAWWWADYDPTLWAIALAWDVKERAVGLLIGPFKIGLRW